MFKPEPGYRLEAHVVKSHGACRLNRDGSDRPKTVYMGASRRLRKSSQTQKQSIRKSDIFSQFSLHASKIYGTADMVRTRQAGECVKNVLLEKIIQTGKAAVDYHDQIDTALKTLPLIFSKNKENQESDDVNKLQVVSLSQTEIDQIAECMLTVDPKGEIIIRDCAETVKTLRKERNSVGPLSPEIQLFGRFTTASVFLKNIDCPLQVSHAFTTHEARIDYDYWTTVDDLNMDSDNTGAAHIGQRAFGAGVFYHYYCLDVPLLSRNIAAAFPTLDSSKRINLTQDLIAALLYATLLKNPVGGQNGHANHDLPYFAYLTYGNAFPYSAQSAFEAPVQPDKSEGYLKASKDRFEAWLNERRKRYGIFSGFESGMGLDEFDVNLQTLVETTVEKTIPVITREMAS